MGYLIGDKLALLHPPKTGGIWARTACKAVGLPWERYAGDGSTQCQHADVPPPGDRRVMVFVRHPVTFLKSFWMFHQRTGWDQFTDSPGFIFYACHRRGEDFAHFVARYLDRMPGSVGRMFARYTKHADMIGKVEMLPADLARFVGEVHPEIDTEPLLHMPRRNASPAEQKLVTTFAPGQVEWVKKAESLFIKRYGY
jgi:hypothetical protein